MSAWATTWAYEQEIGPCGKKAVLVALAHFADEDGFCYPGQETLAGMTSQGVSTVRAHVESLEKDGLINRDKRYKKGKRTSDGFHLQAPTERLKPQSHYRRKSAVVHFELPPEKECTTAEKPTVLPPDSAHDLLGDPLGNYQTKPRKRGSVDDGPKFGVEMIRQLPDEWLTEQRALLKRKYPDLNFDYYHDKWCLSRFSNGGIGRGRRHTVTLNQFAADLELYFANCEENRIDRAGRGNGSGNQKPVWMAPDR